MIETILLGIIALAGATVGFVILAIVVTPYIARKEEEDGLQ